VGVLTASDKGARGERVDESGPAIAAAVGALGWEVVSQVILPDDRAGIADMLRWMADEQRVDVIFTTGGTGFASRDVTPEATLDVVEKLVPGLPELMRAESLKHTPRAALSRAVAGIRGFTLIVNLPGSPRAVLECLEAILSALPHGVEILRGEAAECARKEG
jgi:molybdenum cofactor synthesis domain-containing protein